MSLGVYGNTYVIPSPFVRLDFMYPKLGSLSLADNDHASVGVLRKCHSLPVAYINPDSFTQRHGVALVYCGACQLL